MRAIDRDYINFLFSLRETLETHRREIDHEGFMLSQSVRAVQYADKIKVLDKQVASMDVLIENVWAQMAIFGVEA